MEVGKFRNHLEISQSNNNRINKENFNLKHVTQRLQTEKNEVTKSVNDEIQKAV